MSEDFTKGKWYTGWWPLLEMCPIWLRNDLNYLIRLTGVMVLAGPWTWNRMIWFQNPYSLLISRCLSKSLPLSDINTVKIFCRWNEKLNHSSHKHLIEYLLGAGFPRRNKTRGREAIWINVLLNYFKHRILIITRWYFSYTRSTLENSKLLWRKWKNRWKIRLFGWSASM